MADETVCVLTRDGLLAHWQGQRRVTRRTIERFPDGELFAFSVGGMRPFGVLVREFLGMTMPTVEGLLTGRWNQFSAPMPATKEEVLQMWDEVTAQLGERFPLLPEETFAATHTAFGQWTMTGIGLLEYVIENEVHHRGQGYVYLRAMGIEPPAFWERG